MGYFDGLTSGSFKTTPDGRWLFFPWGVLGSGYAIGSEQDYERLRRQIKAFAIVSLVLIVASSSFRGYMASVVVGALLITFYLAWMWPVLHRLKASSEKLSLQESMTSQANAYGAVMLWLLEIVALTLVGGGIFLLIVDPRQWLVALASVVLFGLCAAKIARMLMLRRRTVGIER